LNVTNPKILESLKCYNFRNLCLKLKKILMKVKLYIDEAIYLKIKHETI